jgi:hypothetical protein
MLDPVQGWYEEVSLIAHAKLSANVSIVAYSGRGVHRNSAGEWEMGAVGKQVPHLLMWSSDRPQSGNSGLPYYKGGIPNGNLLALCCLFPYEVETTEFDTARDYAIDDRLRSISSQSDQTTGGRMTNQSAVNPSSAGATFATVTTTLGIVTRTYTASTDSTRDAEFRDRLRPTLRFYTWYTEGANGI